MISVIITAYKEHKTIGRAIEAILDNDLGKDYEVIVSAPDEETLSVAREYSKKNKKIKLLKDEGKGKPAALNMVFKKARGDILILTDGDVYVGKDSLAGMIEKFSDEKIGAVAARPVSTSSRKKMLGFWSHILTEVADKRRKIAVKTKRRFFCSGYLFAMKRGLVKEIPTETLSDDGFMSLLVYSKGYRLDYSPGSLVYVSYPTTFRDWVLQKKRSAGGYNQIKAWTKKEIRSFGKESMGAFQVLNLARSLKELFWVFVLFFARVYLWILIFIDINIKKKKLSKIWLRVESTK